MHIDLAYWCIIATTTKWDNMQLFLKSKKNFFIRLHSSIFVYTCLVTRLNSSRYSSTLDYIHLHSSVTRLHPSTLVCTHLVTRLCFYNRSVCCDPGSNNNFTPRCFSHFLSEINTFAVWSNTEVLFLIKQVIAGSRATLLLYLGLHDALW